MKCLLRRVTGQSGMSLSTDGNLCGLPDLEPRRRNMCHRACGSSRIARKHFLVRPPHQDHRHGEVMHTIGVYLCMHLMSAT